MAPNKSDYSRHGDVRERWYGDALRHMPRKTISVRIKCIQQQQTGGSLSENRLQILCPVCCARYMAAKSQPWLFFWIYRNWVAPCINLWNNVKNVDYDTAWNEIPAINFSPQQRVRYAGAGWTKNDDGLWRSMSFLPWKNTSSGVSLERSDLKINRPCVVSLSLSN